MSFTYPRPDQSTTNLRHRTPHFPLHLPVSPAAPQVWPERHLSTSPCTKHPLVGGGASRAPPFAYNRAGPGTTGACRRARTKTDQSVLIRPNGGKRLMGYFGSVVRFRADSADGTSGLIRGELQCVDFTLNYMYMYSSWALHFVAGEYRIGPPQHLHRENSQTPRKG